MVTPILPVEPKPEYQEYLLFSGAALLGSIARAGKWVDANGKFVPSKLITELASAVVFGVIAAGIGTYLNWKPEIVGGVSGAAGLIGAPGVTAIIQAVISIRIGDQKDGGDSKAS